MKLAGLACALGLMSAMAAAEPRHLLLPWSDLTGWPDDDPDQALSTFADTCEALDGPNWGAVCALAIEQSKTPGAGLAFFEEKFRPVLIEDGTPGLFTGYYEPELAGSRVRTAEYRWPIYRKPPEVKRGEQWFSREEIETRRVLENRGLELVWLNDPVDAFFLHIQGSGRIKLDDGSALRVGFGGRNGHPYRSVGSELARRGLLEPHQVSAGMIRSWVRKNPRQGVEILRHNPSYIFFREITSVAPDKGPLGAMSKSVTPLRSVAVDPEFTPLGAPVWIEKAGRDPLNRLMIAQDTGAAIKGPQRADIFFGSGEEAGQRAGRVKDPGRMIVLLPVKIALELASDP